MKSIFGYIRQYIHGINWLVMAPSVFLISFLIYLNYRHLLYARIRSYDVEHQYVSWYFIFLGVLLFPYIGHYIFEKSRALQNARLLALLAIAPALFAWKMVYRFDLALAEDVYQNGYWNAVLYWPLKGLVITLLLYLIWWVLDRGQQPFYGCRRQQNIRPYLWMLLFMVPLVAAASTQPDFLSTYPKLKDVSYFAPENRWLYRLLFELSYGSDFFTIELFFRGFLVLAFARWVGKDAILPMALFYCTIHFGKPLGECISSFFGGLLLGMVTLHTRSIWGGFLVHVGIAWLMEIGGYIGNALRSY